MTSQEMNGMTFHQIYNQKAVYLRATENLLRSQVTEIPKDVRDNYNSTGQNLWTLIKLMFLH
jgi:hypothetical protein